MNNQDQNQRLTAYDLKGWPRSACVAFAARCARRVQPMFLADWPDAPAGHTEALETAITLGEQLAAKAVSVGAADRAAARAAARAAIAARANATDYKAAAHAAHAAVAAADAARSASAYAYAAARAARVAKAARADVTTEYTKLKQAIDRGDIDHDTPVSPSFFGPMWPDGVPDGWPDVDPLTGRSLETSSKDLKLQVEIDLPDDLSEDEIKQAIVELTLKLNAAHRERGGQGLDVREIRLPQTAGVPAGVDS
ncbi:MAG: hypothetical protein AAF663_08980 [Planctomycetota bacterium]